MGSAETGPDGASEELPGGAPGPFHTVLLVGFMGSGKTTVGRRVAELLGWDFLDFDDRIEAESGRTIPEIFRDDGEAAFRTLEERVGEEALAGRERVLAPGGGWAVRPGRLEGLDPGVLTVWLDVSPETAVARATGGDRVRPLLESASPEARASRAAELLAERLPYYQAARVRLDANRHGPAHLARAIVERVRDARDPGGPPREDEDEHT